MHQRNNFYIAYSHAIELIKTYLMATDLNFKNTNKSEDVDITELDYLYKSMRNIDKDSVLVKKWIENNKIIQGTEDLLKM